MDENALHSTWHLESMHYFLYLLLSRELMKLLLSGGSVELNHIIIKNMQYKC